MSDSAKINSSKSSSSNSFARSVAMLAGGTTAAQLILIASSPLLTRLYSPDDFGVLAIFVSLLSIISVIANLRYHFAIPMPDTPEEAIQVMALGLLVVIGMSSLSVLIIFWFSNPIANTLNAPILSNYLWLFPIGLFLTGLHQIFNNWAIRTKEFRTLAHAKLFQSIMIVVIQASLFTFGPVGLLVGRIIGIFTVSISIATRTFSHWLPLTTKITLPNIQKALINYRKLPIYSTWGGLVNKAGQELPPILFAAFFSTTIAGFYALAHRVIAMPMALIGRAIADVFFANASDDQHNLGALVRTVHYYLANIGMPITLLIIVSGPYAFGLVFGQEWRDAGTVASALAPMLYAQLTVAPLIRTLMVLGKQGYDLVLQIFLMSARILGIFIGVWNHDPILSVVLYSAASVIGYSVYLNVINVLSGNSIINSITPTLKALIPSSICVLPAFIARITEFGTLAQLSLNLITIAFIIALFLYLRYKSTTAPITARNS